MLEGGGHGKVRRKNDGSAVDIFSTLMFSRSFGTRWHEKEREKVWNWFNLMLSGERNEYFPLFRKFFSDLAGFYVHIGWDYVPQWCSWAVKSPELLSSPLWAANRKFFLRVFIRINLWICRCRFGINLQLTYHPIFQAEGVGDDGRHTFIILDRH